ncbi:hypothetical protein COSO111634_25475 [Corallococcus soli]
MTPRTHPSTTWFIRTAAASCISYAPVPGTLWSSSRVPGVGFSRMPMDRCSMPTSVRCAGMPYTRAASRISRPWRSGMSSVSVRVAASTATTRR